MKRHVPLCRCSMSLGTGRTANYPVWPQSTRRTDSEGARIAWQVLQILVWTMQISSFASLVGLDCLVSTWESQNQVSASCWASPDQNPAAYDGTHEKLSSSRWQCRATQHSANIYGDCQSAEEFWASIADVQHKPAQSGLFVS